jgi:hypothetical protein
LIVAVARSRASAARWSQTRGTIEKSRSEKLSGTLNDYRADPATDAIGRLAIMAYSAMSGRRAAVRRKIKSGPRPLQFCPNSRAASRVPIFIF